MKLFWFKYFRDLQREKRFRSQIQQNIMYPECVCDTDVLDKSVNNQKCEDGANRFTTNYNPLGDGVWNSSLEYGFMLFEDLELTRYLILDEPAVVCLFLF